MRVAGQEKKNEIDTSLAADAADACMVARMRLVLSVSALLVVFVDPASLRGVGGSTWLLFCGYVLHSLVVYVYSELEAPLSQSRVIHWLDICWYALIVLLTDGVHSPFFLFFFFAILTSSFRWGFEEGARVTLASVALFAACGMGSATAQDLPRLLLRSTFILALGYMIIYWGRSKVELKRRLALLRAVSRLSNPRFGVDHTVTGILEKIQRFFLDSNTCLLVVRDKESGACSLRTIRQGDAHRSPQAARIAPELAALLMALAPHRAVIYRRSRWPRLQAFGGAATYDGEKGRWTKETHPACDGLAELLEAGAFISVPVKLRKSDGRLFVLSRCGAFRRPDALFLGHVVAQAFPVVESIELLDRMASDAASQERLKIALDLHDTAIQPYIGLKMGLSALRNKASADNPLVEDLDKLQDMAARVIGDLRRYAGAVRNGLDRSEQAVLMVLRQQAAQVRDFYGIDIAVCVEGELNVNDRMAAEILQIVREGLNNICKHTLAHCGAVRLACADGLLRVEIQNEADGTLAMEFLPRSICERASALGGNASVQRSTGGATSVHVEIPM
ncbi:histidine kinase [Variovorax guangxiensis]|uniref:sensor histidine kinase n=1 Tax=Variovorax guangxiensis TaxID=1775474 RepID=UPI00285F799B|nr:histidine kinase [Variovorax guangxiensis]MDR6857409.1 signal transduction histidine kinase [Variovorax guangxiensis]